MNYECFPDLELPGILARCTNLVSQGNAGKGEWGSPFSAMGVVEKQVILREQGLEGADEYQEAESIEEWEKEKEENEKVSDEIDGPSMEFPGF